MAFLPEIMRGVVTLIQDVTDLVVPIRYSIYIIHAGAYYQGSFVLTLMKLNL
jgi:hypothetical protein